MRNHERQLLKFARKGKVAAFEELIAPHQGIVYNFLLKECGNEFEACQLTQEVFVKVFEFLTSDEAVGSLHTTDEAIGDFYTAIYRTASDVSRQIINVSKKIS